MASPVSAFDAQPELLAQYQEAYPNVQPSLGVLVGYGMSAIMKQVLDAACENGDLTREGVLNAFNELQDVDTGGLVVPINGFETGVSPSTQSFILRPADVPGGATFDGTLNQDGTIAGSYSQGGQTALRVEAEYDTLLGSRWILQWQLEVEAFGQDDVELGFGGAGAGRPERPARQPATRGWRRPAGGRPVSLH